MKTVKIRFTNIEKLVDFVNIMEKESVHADIVDDHVKLNASSLLGVMSLSSPKILNLVFHENESKCERIIKKIADYLI